MLGSDAVEGLTRLVWEGPDHPITPAALHAIANLAADNKQAQDALREAGRHLSHSCTGSLIASHVLLHSCSHTTATTPQG